MPDTLLILFMSMLFFLFLAYLPIYFWITEKKLTIFLTLCTLGITMGIPLQHASIIWLLSRFIHAPSYIFNWKWIRTLSWHLSLLCLMTMIFQIIFLNRLTMFTHF